MEWPRGPDFDEPGLVLIRLYISNWPKYSHIYGRNNPLLRFISGRLR
jgi:hypothetical protein